MISFITMELFEENLDTVAWVQCSGNPGLRGFIYIKNPRVPLRCTQATRLSFTQLQL